jgi:hypothetical protein
MLSQCIKTTYCGLWNAATWNNHATAAFLHLRR